MLAAWAVVYSHSYEIAGGPSAADPLCRLLGGPCIGDYAVQVFFIMSGFLLSASLDANNDPLRFLANRLFRIVPGCCFAILVSVLFIAPSLSDLSWLGVLTSRMTWTSILWSTSELRDLTDIGLSASRYPELAGFLNGSLWTIPYEMVCYLVLLSLYMLLSKDSRVAIAALLLLIVTMAGARLAVIPDGSFAYGLAAIKLPYALSDKTLPYFCGGVLFYACHKRWGAPFSLVLAATGLLLGTAIIGLHDVAMAVAGPVVLAWLGARRSLLSRLTDKLGDVSYGVYLFGWPVGLLVTSLTNSTSPLLVFAFSIPIVFALAYSMHRLIEVPVAIAAKPTVFRRLPSFAIGAPELPFMRRAAHAIAYAFCLIMILRFVIFPYPFSLNWFGAQWQTLVGICLVMAVILKLGERLSVLR